eukprot:GHVL01019931.1.p1 GENE.GHVL01019931.1~~GHVL01019931.1.p1  ORF type:complete len:198 (+),score=26.26 GHVL01019931.1:29-595(+)
MMRALQISLFFVSCCLLENVTSWRQSALQTSQPDKMDTGACYEITNLLSLYFPKMDFKNMDLSFEKYNPEWNRLIGRLDKLKEATAKCDENSINKQLAELIPNNFYFIKQPANPDNELTRADLCYMKMVANAVIRVINEYKPAKNEDEEHNNRDNYKMIFMNTFLEIQRMIVKEKDKLKQSRIRRKTV